MNADPSRHTPWSCTQATPVGNGMGVTDSGILIPLGKYCVSHYETVRRKTRTCEIGPVKVGSDHPIALQTMVTADTAKVDAVVDEVRGTDCSCPRL